MSDQPQRTVTPIGPCATCGEEIKYGEGYVVGGDQQRRHTVCGPEWVAASAASSATIDLLQAAQEFVADLSHKKKSHEPAFQHAAYMYIPPAEELRRRAEKIEHRDAMIDRARQLLPKIEEAIRAGR